MEEAPKAKKDYVVALKDKSTPAAVQQKAAQPQKKVQPAKVEEKKQPQAKKEVPKEQPQSGLRVKLGSHTQRPLTVSWKRCYQTSNSPSYIEKISQIETFLFDCDGVIWRGNELVPQAAETLQWLRDQGKQVFFVTNNSTKSRRGYLQRFLSLNLQAEESEIFPSSYAGALYLSRAGLSFDNNKKVFMIGESGISEELTNHKIPFTEECDFDRYEDINAVIVGLDRSINYKKIDFAQQCLNNNKNCLFVATNTDSVSNVSATRTAPGNGFIVGALKGCTGRDPIVAGKPSSLLIDLIAQSNKLNPSKICMIGDRLDTDILFGNQNNLLTCLVMTGVTTPDTLKSNQTPARPDFVLDSMANLRL